MKFRHSLRMRIVVAYCIFGAVLGAVFAVAVYISLDFIDDSLVNTRLTQEIDHLGTLYQNNVDLLSPASSNIDAYVSVCASAKSTLISTIKSNMA